MFRPYADEIRPFRSVRPNFSGIVELVGHMLDSEQLIFIRVKPQVFLLYPSLKCISVFKNLYLQIF